MENRNCLKQVFAIVLAAVLVLMMIPVTGTQTAYADTETPFTITVGGSEISASDITVTEKTYAYFDYMANETAYYDLYTVKVPEGTEKATLNFGSKENLVYNYDAAGNYLAGWVDDYTKGTSEIEITLDSDNNGELDYVQVQNPYNADYTGGEMLYAVTFDDGSSDETADAAAELTEDDLGQMLLNVNVTTKAAYTSKNNVKVTFTLDKTTKQVLDEIEGYGYTIKYQYCRSEKKSSGYTARITKTGKSFINTVGTKGKTYYYKVRIAVYKDGKLAAKSALQLSTSASRKWTK